ncbi:MAG: glucose-6-phosphate dehydrogenase, partial [Chloroflexota bacterium]
MPATQNTLVIFGATGDLTQRKLIPALFNQYVQDNLPDDFTIVGFSIEDYMTETLCERLHEGIQQFSSHSYDPAHWATF